jgi:hypothetical protein
MATVSVPPGRLDIDPAFATGGVGRPHDLPALPAQMLDEQSLHARTGVWGIWMPGFMQFIAGVYLFAGLTLFGTFKTPSLYMAALAFTAYGVHWFAMGWNRLRRSDPRVNVGTTIAFLLISILGIIVFFKVGDAPVGGLFVGLACVYAVEDRHALRRRGGGRWRPGRRRGGPGPGSEGDDPRIPHHSGLPTSSPRQRSAEP